MAGRFPKNIKSMPCKKYSPSPCRHVTVGKNAGLVWQHSSRGNTWIKKGGAVQYLDSFVENTHTFCRNDNEQSMALVDHLYIQKTAGASVVFMLLLGKVDLDGVLFEDVLKGGILLSDPEVRSHWKNVFYGGNNGGKPAEFCRRWEGKGGN